MAAATSGNVMLRQCPKLLMPGMIEFIAKNASSVVDDKTSEGQTAALGEIWKATSVLFSAVPEGSRTCLSFDKDLRC
jgi:hypothetical protein